MVAVRRARHAWHMVRAFSAALVVVALALAPAALAQTPPLPPVPVPGEPQPGPPPVVITDPEAAIEEGSEPEQEVLADRVPSAPAPTAPSSVAPAAPSAPAAAPPAQGPPAGQLPFTGLGAGWLALLGASMCLLGLALHPRISVR